VARDLVRAAVSNVFDGYFGNADLKPITDWFDMGGSLSLSDETGAATLLREAAKVQGLVDLARHAGVAAGAAAPLLASGIDFALEGLYSQKKISRSDGRGYHGSEGIRRPQPQQTRSSVLTQDDEDDDIQGGPKKKRYYN